MTMNRQGTGLFNQQAEPNSWQKRRNAGRQEDEQQSAADVLNDASLQLNDSNAASHYEGMLGAIADFNHLAPLFDMITVFAKNCLVKIIQNNKKQGDKVYNLYSSWRVWGLSLMVVIQSASCSVKDS